MGTFLAAPQPRDLVGRFAERAGSPPETTLERSTRDVDVLTRETLPDGSRVWRDALGRPHRDDAPALDAADGKRAWYRGGVLHRSDGPAVEHADGRVEFWVDGVRRGPGLTTEEIARRAASLRGVLGPAATERMRMRRPRPGDDSFEFNVRGFRVLVRESDGDDGALDVTVSRSARVQDSGDVVRVAQRRDLQTSALPAMLDRIAKLR